MLIRITGAGEAFLEEAENFQRFSIRFDPGARGSAAAEAALGRLAQRDGEVAWVQEAALKGMTPLGQDPSWRAGLADMVAFARGRGWVDEGGGIRAHIEAPS